MVMGRFIERLRWTIGLLGFGAILVIMFSTLADIAVRSLANLTGELLPRSLPGLVDVTELAQVTAAHMSVAAGFLAGAHVTVDLLTTQLTSRQVNVLHKFGNAVSALTLAACAFAAWKQFSNATVSASVSSVLGWPQWVYWLPVATGLSLAVLTCVISAFLVDKTRKGRS